MNTAGNLLTTSPLTRPLPSSPFPPYPAHPPPCPVPSPPVLLSWQAFFMKWWGEQGPAARDRVRGLVASGQLQFVNGGLVQHDESTSHYSSIVDQMTAGMRYGGHGV